MKKSNALVLVVLSIATAIGFMALGATFGSKAGYNEGMSEATRLLVSASASAKPSNVRVPGSESATREDAVPRAASSSSGGPPAGSSEPAPGGSARSVTWTAILPRDADTWLIGRWVSVANGDAIPGGPKGGEIIAGGVRAEFVKGRPGSKTPWNLTFWAPKSGHISAKTISGGCGFYPSGVAFCQGYGLPPSQHAHETRIAMMMSDQGPEQMQFVITDLVASGPLKKVLP